MSLIDEMRNLRENIDSGNQVRKRRIQEIKNDLRVFRGEATKRRDEFKGELVQARKAFWTHGKSKKG